MKNMIHTILNHPLIVGGGAIAATEAAETILPTSQGADPAQAVHIIVQIIIGIATLIKMFRKPKQTQDETQNS